MKLKKIINDCCERVFRGVSSVCSGSIKNYQKHYKYSTSVQITSDIQNILAERKRTTNKIVAKLKQSVY